MLVERYLRHYNASIAAVSALGSLFAFAAVLVALWQFHDARKAQDAASYASISAGWHDHMALFLESPELRPYYFNGRKLSATADETLRSKVETMADMRLDAMDRVLIAAQLSGWDQKDTEAWRGIFKRAFRDSPQLCETLGEVSHDYEKLTDLAECGCQSRLLHTDRLPDGISKQTPRVLLTLPELSLLGRWAL